jgi:hypothetical protein
MADGNRNEAHSAVDNHGVNAGLQKYDDTMPTRLGLSG